MVNNIHSVGKGVPRLLPKEEAHQGSHQGGPSLMVWGRGKKCIIGTPQLTLAQLCCLKKECEACNENPNNLTEEMIRKTKTHNHSNKL